MTLVLGSASLVNVAARGRPGASATQEASGVEVAVFVDLVAMGSWRSSASRDEVATAIDTPNRVGFTHNVSRAEFGTPSDLVEAIGGNAPPAWGSAPDTVFFIQQGSTLDLNHALRFTDPEDDVLSFTQIAGLLPDDATVDLATGIISAALTTPVGLHPDNLIFEADDGQSNVLLVGPGRPYTTIRAAVLASQDNDIIQIDAGDYIGDVVTINANNLHIKGVGGRARLFANGVYEAQKGIWVLEGDGCTIENIDFHDAAVPDQNGAGIRLDGGDTTIRDCGFFDCENGILSGGSGFVRLERCEFARNGFGDGFTHNCYFLTHNLVEAFDCYFHEAKIGHEFKSRAKINWLERCYFVGGPTGTASYVVNVDNGGSLIMKGCCLHKGPNADNNELIFHNTNTWGASFNSIALTHCTLVSDFPNGQFINLASSSTQVNLTTCLFASAGLPLVTGMTPTQSNNYQTTANKVPNADNISDPDFWPDSSIHAAITLGAPVVPTYLIDAPHVFVQRSITPLKIGAIQVVTSPDFWAVPSLQDERDFYTLMGWTRPNALDETMDFPVTAPTFVVSYDVHNVTEGDDGWTWLQQKLRGHSGSHVNATKVLNWIAAWTTYYKGPYLTMLADPGGFEALQNNDHLYGQGLVLKYFMESDAAALTAAETIADVGIDEYSLNHDDTNPQPTTWPGVHLRSVARWLIIWTYLAEATGTTKWITWRDHLINNFMNAPNWQEANTNGIVQGGHYFTPRTNATSNNNHWTNGVDPTPTGSGAADFIPWDSGRRFNSAFFYALNAEALWRVFLSTGRADVRARLIKMARFVQHYAHNPTDYVADGGPFTGSWWGHQAGGYYHRDADAFGIDSAAAAYDMCAVNTLVWGYKLTGDAALLARAKIHFRQATRWAEAGPGNGSGPEVGPTEVNQFVDVRHGPTDTPHQFNFNKGQLQYCYQLFENGGEPTIL